MPSSPLPDGWHWTRLTDVARLETGHTPSRKHPEYWGGDVPWIGTKDATANHGSTLFRTNQYTNDLGIANSSARVLPVNTVCLSRTASVGYVVVMGRPMATSQDFVNWVCSEDLDFRYLKYVLLAERESFLRFASGTTHQTIYFPEVKAFHAALPPIREQERIADTLSALDDRIDLLRQSNATLEDMAQALFKSWFVDFVPVRAKAEGREPDGMDAATAALFPSEFEDSQLGLIPKGWRVGTLLDLLELQRGFDLPATQRVPGAYPIIAASGPAGTHAEAKVQGPGIVTGRSGVLGKVFLELEDFWPLNTTLWIKNYSACGPSYAYELLRRIDFQQFNAGSAVPTLNRNHVHGLPQLLPPQEAIQAFELIALSMHRRVHANSVQVQLLSEIRDTLLPRLISGRLRLPKVEESIEEAVA
nr:restriction endonuclease subunit S [Dokdonella sp.]